MQLSGLQVFLFLLVTGILCQNSSGLEDDVEFIPSNNRVKRSHHHHHKHKSHKKHHKGHRKHKSSSSSSESDSNSVEVDSKNSPTKASSELHPALIEHMKEIVKPSTPKPPHPKKIIAADLDEADYIKNAMKEFWGKPNIKSQKNNGKTKITAKHTKLIKHMKEIAEALPVKTKVASPATIFKAQPTAIPVPTHPSTTKPTPPTITEHSPPATPEHPPPTSTESLFPT